MADIKWEDEAYRDAFRHTSSHILAQAVKKFWPEAKLAIGPAIENGFYYDFDLDHKFTEDDFAKIEEEMRNIIKEDLPLEHYTMPRDEALKFWKDRNEDYKVELIEDLPDEKELSFYRQGDYVDLCAGPHVESTGVIGAVKLTSVAGAYWRGDSDNKMLQRIYGTSFPTQEMLDEYLEMIEEAKKRDHRKIGKEMEIFEMHEEGPGFAFFLPKGMVLRNELTSWWRQVHKEWGYDEIMTPMILNEQLWRTSGHWDHYKDDMYFTQIDGEDYAIKPMNCPGSILIYGNKIRSYRDLPLRYAELGRVHRHELSGTLQGLMRVRSFVQDDAHMYCTMDQVKDTVQSVARLIDYMYSVFGFEYIVELSTRPENSMGTDEEWDLATEALREAVEDLGMEYRVNEGDGAFYGPKLDFHLVDALGRTWQCGTNQLDFQMPQRFGISYIGPDGEKHRPVMIHRTVFGSIERFIGILIEHFEGKFPLWLAPVQIKLLTVTESQADHAEKLRKELEDEEFRVEVDARNEKIGYKMREARNARDSYICVIGDKEIADGTLSVRSIKTGDLGSIKIDDFKNKLHEEIDTKAL